MHRLLLVAFTLLLFSSAHAADQTVLGTVLTVRNPSTAAWRRIIIKEKETGGDNRVGSSRNRPSPLGVPMPPW